MKYGINIPNYEKFSNPENLIVFAEQVEKSGWDGLFIWDHLQLIPQYFRGIPFIDPYVALTIIASHTKKIKLGPYVTPLSRRRPWQVYRQITSIDQLSKGRVMFGVGLGTPAEFDFESFGEESDPKIRGQLLDEALEIIELLSSGEEISYDGKHFHLDKVQLLPRPYNKKIPIFVGGQWPNKAPFKRGAKFDGIVPITINWPDMLTPNDIALIKSFVERHRKPNLPLEIMVGGETTKNRTSKHLEMVKEFEKVGVTWWSENIDTWDTTFDELLDQVKVGPPIY